MAEQKPRGRGSAGGRSLLAGVGLIGTGAIVAASLYLPLPAGTTSVDARNVSLPLADTLLGCSGPFQTNQEVEGTDEEFSTGEVDEEKVQLVSVPSGEGSPAAGLTATSLGTDGPGAVLADHTPGPAFASQPYDLSDPLGILGTAQEETPALVQAGQTIRASDGDYRGLAAANCSPAATESWLVAGATTIGENSQLVITNPGGQTAQVALEFYSEAGKVDTAENEPIAVAAGASHVVAVTGLAPDVAELAIRVSSSDGLVSASLHTSALRGLVPGGIETVTPSAPPAVQALVPAVSITDDRPEADAAGPALRIVNPGGSPADVTIEARDGNGRVDWSTTATSVAAGGVAEVPLTGLTAGTYQFLLDSDQPITASARFVAASGADAEPGAVDVAWSPATSMLSGKHLLAVPQDTSAQLVLGSRSSETGGTVWLTSVGTDASLAEPQEISVAPGRANAFEIDPSGETAAILIDTRGNGGLYAGVFATAEDGSLVTGLAVAPPPPGAGSAAVRVEG